MPYNAPIRDTFYGVPLYYRIERRKGIETLIISYRDEVNTSTAKPRIVYEAPPVGGKKLRLALQAILPTLVNGEGLLMALPDEIMSRFMHSWIGLDDAESYCRRRDTPGLTLGALLIADKEKLLYNTDVLRKEESIKDDVQMIDKLMACFGSFSWREVTPRICAEWLSRKSEHAKKSCKRVMLRFERIQLQAGLTDCLSWEEYNPKSSGRVRKSSKSLVQSQVEHVILTDGQCAQIIGDIEKRICNGKVTGVDMAVLLRMSADLDVEYISALNLNDFIYLSDYRTRLSINITRVAVKVNTNFMCKEIEDPYMRRKIPLPTIAARCYEALVAKARCLDLPLVADPGNRHHRMSPKKLKDTMAYQLAAIHIERVTDEKGIKKIAAVDMLGATGLREMECAGAEEEELRAMCGKRPRLVSAKHYYDRNNESALNKIGALQDRWLNRISPVPQEQMVKKSKLTGYRSTLEWRAPDLGKRTRVWIDICIPPAATELISEGELILELSAAHGLTAEIRKRGIA